MSQYKLSTLILTFLLINLSGCAGVLTGSIPEAIPVATPQLKPQVSCACPVKKTISPAIRSAKNTRTITTPIKVKRTSRQIPSKTFLASYTAQQRSIFGPPLSYAVSTNNLTLTKQLLDSGVNIEAPDRMNLTPLGLAIIEKSPRMVELLLQRGANISADVPPHGQPLVAAIEVGSPPVVKVLLKHGVDKNTARHHWRRPLDIAREKGNPTIVTMLEKANASSANDDFKRESAEMKMYDRMGHYGHP